MKGEDIKRIRERLNLTLEELGKELGVSAATMYRKENDLTPIKKLEAEAIRQMARDNGIKT